MDEQNKNMLMAVGLSFVVILLWVLLFAPDEPQVPVESQQVQQEGISEDGVAVTPPTTGSAVSVASNSLGEVPLDQALENSDRITINTPSLTGSISLTGGRIDDLSLKRYNETLKEDSDIVRLLSPAGVNSAYYVLFGWSPAGNLEFADVPGSSTPWTIESGRDITPETPLVLAWTNDKGVTFRRVIEVDEDYLFTVTQSVTNNGDSTLRMAPYGIIARHGEPQNLQNFFILHEGVVRMTDGELQEIDYDNVPDLDYDTVERANLEKQTVQSNGWVGFTDKYWMTTLAPQSGTPFTSVAKYSDRSDIYQAESRYHAVEVYPNSTVETVTYLFAGAKQWTPIKNYQDYYGIDRFEDSIDWGWFFFLTKPIFQLLYWINGKVGNMGWSILCLTLIIKALLFPLAYKSYVSMARMKELQPEMEKIKERVGDDRKRMQQEMMAMYRERKINPAAGCLPILPQIPIFFSLYKVIFVTIEMRHAPFILWVRDLSAPDPTSILNLFGALPWSAPETGSLLALISLGVLPIMLGVSMWLQQKLNPAPTDPTQAMVFAWLPWVFMFMLGQFASGLIIYWIANNLITFAQQYIIMRSQGVKPDILGNIRSGFAKTNLPIIGTPKKKDEHPPPKTKGATRKSKKKK
ncbi:MAG: membrane protein insertase YidC [Rhodobacteraceae bacterium]|nr:membrane protein insertase YidC [Paracoccaceae bacterium]MYF46273.1 membrane protein insertase YidC [Paracoccaceae bacterium]MYI91055.1 membrane protein insertase YidC [Paracoccaceae bacterium]